MVAEGRLGGDKVLLVKPQTLMNLSGQAVGEALRFYKLDLATSSSSTTSSTSRPARSG